MLKAHLEMTLVQGYLDNSVRAMSLKKECPQDDNCRKNDIVVVGREIL